MCSNQLHGQNYERAILNLFGSVVLQRSFQTKIGLHIGLIYILKMAVIKL